MNKAVMISIQPKWCELIASGKKTIEVRKTKPKVDTHFKCYIYCTNQKIMGELLLRNGNLIGQNRGFREIGDIPVAGKVIGEFVCDYVDECIPDYNPITKKFFSYDFWDKRGQRLQDCLTDKEKAEYAKGKLLYGWHISQLKIYDKPKGLSEFKVKCKDDPLCDGCLYFISCTGVDYDESDCAYDGYKPLTRPPQSWCYVEEL